MRRGCDFCPLVDNGVHTCVEGGCGFQCDAGYAACEGGCHFDSDGDGNAGNCDLCPGHNDNADIDGDGVPNGCDADMDGDGCLNGDDDAQAFASPDTDGDGVHDDCDDDDDGDDCPDFQDPAPGLDDGGCTPSCPPDAYVFTSTESNDTLETAQDLGGPWYYTPSRLCIEGVHHCTSSSWLSGEKDHVVLSVNPADFSWNPDAKLDLTLQWTYPADMDIRTYSVEEGEFVFSGPVQQGKQETASLDVAPTTGFPSYIIETRCDSGPPGPQDYILLIEFSLPN